MSEHRKRILERVLRPNFVGAVLHDKSILPSKVQLFDITADISISHETDDVDVLSMNYGDMEYLFRIDYVIKECGEKNKCLCYRIGSIK